MLGERMGGGGGGPGPPVEDRLIHVATSASELAAIWPAFFRRRPLPEVSFRDEIVVVLLALVSVGCPELDFTGIEVDATRSLVYGTFRTPRRGQNDGVSCIDIAASHTFVVAVERDLLPRGEVTIRVRQEYQLCENCGVEEVRLRL